MLGETAFKGWAYPVQNWEVKPMNRLAQEGAIRVSMAVLNQVIYEIKGEMVTDEDVLGISLTKN